MAWTKTTVEIPDDLFRAAKAGAALTRARLKDLVAEGWRLVLASPQQSPAAASSEPSTPKRQAPSYPLVLPRAKGKVAITNEIIAELDEEQLVRGAFGGHYRLRHTPVTVSEGNEIRALTHAEVARMLETEETSGTR